MIEHISGVLDIIEQDDQVEMVSAIDDVQDAYLEIIKHALSLLMQSDTMRCKEYLTEQRHLLEPCKARIGDLVEALAHAPDEHHRLLIEYLHTHARLVDETRIFPNFAIELLERSTMSESLDATISHLEHAMTGKVHLYNEL